MYDKLNNSEIIQSAAEGLPNHVVRCEEILLLQETKDRSGTMNYIVRVKSEDDPTVTVFSFYASELEVAGRLRKAASRKPSVLT